MLAVNKTEGMREDVVAARIPRARPRRAARRSPPSTARACASLIEDALAPVPARADAPRRRSRPIRAWPSSGRPNVGKSTLVNAWLGEERLVAFDQPGTTRDAIEVPFEAHGQALHARSTPRACAAAARCSRRSRSSRWSRRCRRSSDANVVLLLLDADARASPTRTPTSPATSSRRPRAGGGGEQVGRDRERQAQGREERSGAQAAVPGLRRVPQHLGAPRHGIEAPAAVRGHRVQGGHGEAVHAQAHPGAAGGRGAAAAAHVGALPPQDALRPPGRLQSPDRRDPRRRAWTA